VSNKFFFFTTHRRATHRFATIRAASLRDATQCNAFKERNSQ